MLKKYLLAGLWAVLACCPSMLSAENRLTATIGDFVWRDLDSDGVQDAGEPGLTNVYVQLETAAGGYVNAAFTNSNGGYTFTGVAAGSYRIKFANPGGFFVSDQDKGADDGKDSDADLNGYTAAFSVAAGQIVTNIDCGFRPQNASTCSLTISAAPGAVTCNDNGTPSNSADDMYTAVFSASIASNPNNLPTWGYKIQINNRTFYGAYGMPTAIGPFMVSSGALTWTLVDDDNPTCTATGTLTPPASCSGGGTCVNQAVRTISNTPITCGTPGNDYGFWFAGLTASGLSNEWVWDNGNFVENSNGTAHIIGVISNKMQPNAKFAVDITLTGRTFTAMAGSPKTDGGTCAGTNTSSWYYYAGVSGQLVGVTEPGGPSELAGGWIEISNVGPKPQFGTGASLRNATANGGSSWLTYVVKMQPANINLQFLPAPANNAADFNFQLSGSPLSNCVTPPTCSNVTSGGTIAGDQTICPGATPALLTSATAPTGGSGAIEYQWLSSTTGCPTLITQGIAGANAATYQPGALSATTWFVRCSRRAGCTDWTVGESNCVKVTVSSTGCGGGGTPDCNAITITPGSGQIAFGGLNAPIVMVQVFNASWAQVFSQTYTTAPSTLTVPSLAAGQYFVKVNFLTAGWASICNKEGYYTVTGGGGGCSNVTSGGTIAGDQTICPNVAPALLTSATAPSGGSGAIEYQWLSSTTACPTLITQAITGATSATYQPGALSATTWYVRCSRRAGCTDWTVGESNCVKVTVSATGCGGGCSNVTSGGTIAGDQTICPNVAPALLTSATAPSGGSGAIEYQWLSSTTACPTLVSQGIAGANAATYQPGALSATTWFVRCSRRAGCTDWTVGESNCVKVTVSSTGCGGGGTPDCNAITITPGNGQIAFGGLNAPIVMVQIFNASWAQVFSQTYTTAPSTLTVPSLAAGQYFVKVNFLTAGWQSICNKEGYYTVGNGGGSTPTVSINDVTVNENAGTATLQICLSATSATAVQVPVSTSNGTALGGSDYTTTNTTVTIPANTLCANVSIPIIDNATAEPTETFNVNLGTPVGATINDGTGVVTILDNDQPTTLPTLTVKDVTVNENVGQAQVEVCLSAVSATPVTFTFSTSNGTATSGSDYSTVSTSVTIPANTLCWHVPVSITDDATAESTEAFNVTISGPTGATIADGSGTVTINDNDSGGGTPDCNLVSITPGNGQIVVGGLQAPIVMLQVFNASWAQVFSQTYTTAPGTVTVPSLPAGQYFVKVNFLTAGWASICLKEGYFTVTGAGGACSLTLGFLEANKVCNNNGTPTNPADDTWTVDFTAKVLGNPNNLPVWGWTATINGATVQGMYDMAKPLGPFPISAGNLTFTYADDDNPTCTSSVSIAAPATCSNQPVGVLTLTCGNNISVTAAQGATSAIVNYSAPTASTTCAGGAVTLTRTAGPASGSAFSVGTTTVTYTATDNCGNSKTCSFTVTVNASAAAVLTLTCGNNMTVTAAQGATSAVVNYSAPTASTTCAGGAVNLVRTAGPASGSAFSVGTTTVTYTATDNCGNSKTCSFTVTVNAQAAAVLTLTCGANVSATAACGATTATVNYSVPTASTTCSGGAVTVTRTAGAASGSAFSVGTTTITYTATDNCGNSKTCSFTVTVNAATLSAERSYVKHSFNSCYSNTGNSSPTDYSEFTPTVGAGVTASIVTKNDGTMHSCNPGPNSTLAICTQSSASCTASYGKALAFTMNVSGTGALSTLKFYVRSADPSPISGGTSMANNKLTKVAVRISNGATVVYENTAVPMTSAWTLQTLTLPATITYSGATTFKVEIIGYCAATTHQPNYIWDLDELELLGKDCNATPAPSCSITRTVTNAVECQNNTTYSIYLNGTYYQLTGGQFVEYNDGTAKLTGTTSLGAVNVNFAGRTFTGTAVPSVCYTPNTDNWYYYAGFNGTIGTYTIVGNSMHKFQIGMGGNNQNSASYGGSGWFDTSTGLAGDINIKLSGDRSTLQQMLTNCGSNCVACAISLSQDRLTFNAYRSGLDVKLKWLNNTGEKNEFFDVERSTDGGQNWTKIDRVNGQGPADEMLYFDAIDRNPVVGDNIYRLSMVWKDGTVQHSDEQTIHFDALPTLAVYPNPASEEVFVDLSQWADQRVELKMFNALGILVHQEWIEKASFDPHSIDISRFGAGQFSINILVENQRPQVRKLVIAR